MPPEDSTRKIDPNATANYQPRGKAKAPRALLWVMGGAAVLMVGMCCGGVGAVGVKWWRSPPAERGKDTESKSAGWKLPNPFASDPPIETTADDLYSAYSKDLIAADAKYLKKRVRLSKVTGKIEKDASGRYYIAALKRRAVKQNGGGGRIMSSQEYARRVREAAFNQKYEPAILIYLKADTVASFQGVAETTPLTIEGKCTSTRKDPKTIPDVIVIIEDARRVK